MIKGMHHTGLVVRDLEKAVEFYRDVIGLKVIEERERIAGPVSLVVQRPSGYREAADGMV